MTHTLEDRVAIVTGGARGIGAGIVRALAGAGARIAVWDKDVSGDGEQLAADLEASGQSVLLQSVDIRQSAAIEEALAVAQAHYGRVDMLVNDAGICPFRDLFSITDDVWYDTLNTNLSGMFFTCRAVGRVFREQRRGVIVNISTVSTRIATPHQVHYIASKGGVDALTRALAVALAPYNVRVNAVAPGGVPTAINKDTAFERTQWERSGVPLPGPRWQPISGPGTPADIAAAVLFLVSDEARYITGAVLPVDGGALIV
jgi:NAD(P)-dependent dehydrogenase (short-subunit alcohol dehydrogenase family)